MVRAVALLGIVVLNYYGFLMQAGAPREPGALGALFDPYLGPMAFPPAATFVVVAGAGASLMTASLTGAALRRSRVVLVRRGALLFAVGWVVDLAWRGTILPYFGAMFALAALLVVLPRRRVLLVGGAAAVAASAVSWWSFDQRSRGRSVEWLTDPPHWTPQGLFLDTVVNGTHPLLPWLAFFCAGVLLGRVMGRPGWHGPTLGLGLVLVGAATLVAQLAASAPPTVQLLASTAPPSAGLAYTATTLGAALVVVAGVSWLAERAPRSLAVDVLRRAGTMSLTIYLAHMLVFRVLVDGLDVVPLTGLRPALLLSVAFWAAAVVAAWWWQRRFGIGPAEAAYRRIAG